ncbi:UDP-glucose 4-epimerase GalE [Bacillus sp. JCM 19034]|uniref:UDP-glucose 4-epimerase GalE n=1 Tax=Bacillus sp. JCM 19034 TaxID=1481928 RepID=UPI000785426A|nr:UDP-glucose 4-epimerase GalE [Bacillus sp. JCM 19034]
MILVTGGAGYIGSHTCLELLEAGYEVVVVDNLANSHYESIRRVEQITGKTCYFEQIDLLDRDQLESVFAKYKIEAVIHLAGLKAVGESVEIPLHYYHQNVTGTIYLCEVMQKYGVKKLVFSSSATVYGVSEEVPLDETSPLGATNPYGRTKIVIEEMLRDLYCSKPDWSIALLRYFNPVGAHKSGLIGEDPSGIPNNLIPYITQVAIGKLEHLTVFGDDYPTKDGTGVRDYIHVVDLARGHVKALQKIEQEAGIDAYNLGTGNGYSVLEMIQAFEKVTEQTIPYVVSERRPGDIAICYADPTKAYKQLNWQAEKGLEEMCQDAWKWQQMNPLGYK